MVLALGERSRVVKVMLKQIAVSEVILGMYIYELCGPWLAHPFWKRRFLLNSESDLQRVRDSAVDQVLIDISKGLDVVRSTVSVIKQEPQKNSDLYGDVETPWCQSQLRSTRKYSGPKASIRALPTLLRKCSPTPAWARPLKSNMQWNRSRKSPTRFTAIHMPS